MHKPAGTREQEAVLAWLDRAAVIRNRSELMSRQIPAGLAYFDFLIDAGASFGRCELHARSLERATALKVFPERQRPLQADVARYNADGLDQIVHARATLPFLRKEIEAVEFDRDVMLKRLDDVQRELQLGLADWEMKGSDAVKIFDTAVEAFGVVRKEGPVGLVDYLDRNLGRLDEARRRDDRGAVDNIPFWKLIFIAGFLGWWILTWFACGVFSCSPATGLVLAFIANSHALALILFC